MKVRYYLLFLIIYLTKYLIHSTYSSQSPWCRFGHQEDICWAPSYRKTSVLVWNYFSSTVCLIFLTGWLLDNKDACNVNTVFKLMRKLSFLFESPPEWDISINMINLPGTLLFYYILNKWIRSRIKPRGSLK